MIQRGPHVRAVPWRINPNPSAGAKPLFFLAGGVVLHFKRIQTLCLSDADRPRQNLSSWCSEGCGILDQVCDFGTPVQVRSEIHGWLNVQLYSSRREGLKTKAPQSHTQRHLRLLVVLKRHVYVQTGTSTDRYMCR